MFKIFDLHNDYYFKIRKSKKDRYIEKNSNFCKNIISAIWTTELNVEESMREIEIAKNYINKHNNLFLGIEDLHFLTKDNLDKFLLSRPIYAGLTWNTCNAIAGGASESGNLTRFGKIVVNKLEKNFIQVDTAHLNEDSFMDLSKITTKPIFCSHTAFYGVNQNNRNLKDYQLKMIVDSGGIVGLCLVSDFISGTKKCTIDDVIVHIDYFACKFGIENLAIGTDFYGTKHLPRNISNYESLISGLSSKLIKLGYTEKSINKILYENAQRFFA